MMLLIMLASSAICSAKVIVKGTVTDENKEPLIGVNIVEKGTTNGTVTDLDGKYQIWVKEDAVLVFSYVGYETIEATAREQLNIQLNAAFILEECVVSAKNFKRFGRGKHAKNALPHNKSYSDHTAFKIHSEDPLKHQQHQNIPYDPIIENDFKRVSSEALSTFSIDVDRAAYSNIRSYIESGYLPNQGIPFQQRG